MAGEWGNRQELLHPRDTHGRFRNSFKVPENIISFLEKFNPKTFPSDEEAANYAKGFAQSDRFGTNRHTAVTKFLKGYSTVNADLRAGKTNPDVAEMDKAMRPLPNELILNRVVGPEAFGLTPDNLAGIEEFRGKLIADKGFASTNIGTPMHRDGPSITMVIATPAGTKAIAPWSGGTGSREIILDRDQPFRVTKVQPDGKGGYYMMVAATEKGAPGQKKPITLGGKAPQAPAAEVNQPNAPQAPAAPQAPQAPVAPQVAQPVQQAPVRTGKVGRPAGPPPPPRNEPVHAESIGTGTPSTPVTPVPAAPGTPGQNPPEAELPPDPRVGFKEAYKNADVPVPGQGPRRATYNRAYLDLANRRTNPNEVVEKLDHEIALNDKIIQSDRADGTDSGPLPEDNARLKKFSQFIKDHFNLEGAKKKEEPKATAPKERAPRTPEGFEAPTPEQKAKSDAIKAARAERQKAAGIDRSKPAPRPTPTPEEKAARKERKMEADAAARKEVAKQRAEIRAERRARGEKPHEPTPEQQKAAEVARAAGEQRAAERKVADEKLDAEAAKIANGWLADSGVKEEDLSDFDKTGLRILSGQVAQEKITRLEAQRRLHASSSPNLKKVGDGVKTKKAIAGENAMKEVHRIREQGAEIAKRKGINPPATDQEAAKLVLAEKAPKPVPAPARPQIPAKDLTDKGLLQRFEAEIKKDEPDEKRLKELGDELDRRDLEAANRVKALSDEDLLKRFEAEIKKDNMDEARVKELGDELDRRDAENAKKEQQVEALLGKGRDFKDAWAEVHGKDPDKLAQEERQSLLDANRRAGETREQSLRRQYQESLHHQYLDAERVTRGHLLTPEGRRKGIDPKTLFSGNNVAANKWASDELKEYWQTHPRKTFTQFKADMVGGAANKAAAKKVEGVQRDLELGHKLSRGPKKNIPASSELEAAYKKTTIAQLRQDAANAGIDVPKSLRLKQDIFDHVTKELAKREQGRRGGESIAKFPNPLGLKGSELHADQTIREGWIKHRNPESNWAPIAEVRGELEKLGFSREEQDAAFKRLARGGHNPHARIIPLANSRALSEKDRKDGFFMGGEMNHAIQFLDMDAKGNPKELTPGKVSEPPKPATPETPKPATPERLTPNMAVGKTNVSRLEPGQRVLLEKHANGDWSPAVRKTGAVPAELVKRQPTAVNGRQRNRLTFKTDDGQEVTLYRDYPAHQTFWTEGSRKAPAPKAPVEEKLPAPTKAASAPRRDNTELKTRLKGAQSREEARALIAQEKMTVPQLKQLAEEMDIAVTGNKDKIIGDIIHWSVGRRLDSAAVSKPGATTSRTLTKAAEKTSGPKISDKPVLANHWGTPTGEINFHRDGKLGIALNAIGDDERLEVPGEEDNVANVIGRIATKGVRGDLTQKEMVAEVRKVAEKFPAGSKVRTNLERAVKDMDTPDNSNVNQLVKDLPEGSPTPIAELMHNLAQIPLANQTRRGTSEPTEIEKLQKIMQEWAQGKLTPLGFIAALRNRIFNQRHESEEGKFEIDRVVQDAMKKLEDLMKKDRKLLYPIERR